MRKINRRNTRIAAATVATGAVVVAGTLAASLTATAQAAPLTRATLTAHDSAKQTAWVPLTPMPQGTVWLGRDRSGAVDATVSAFGLTPGSSHSVELVNGEGRVVARFGTLTANGVGQAWASLDSRYRHHLDGARVVILNGTAGDPVSAEPIAQTRHADGGGTYRLTPVEVGADGTRYGTPQGWATVAYDPQARTITVTLTASGLTPGLHADTDLIHGRVAHVRAVHIDAPAAVRAADDPGALADGRKHRVAVRIIEVRGALAGVPE